MPPESSNNQSVERAALVLAAFLIGRPELRVADVARLAELGVSTTSRLLATLEALQYVERDPVSSLYRLGPALITLAGVAVNQHPVHRAARPVAQRLAWELGLGANVAVRNDVAVFYLCNFEGRLAPKSYTLTGQRNPLHATGVGKCLLAGLAGAQRRQLLTHLPGYTARTITEHAALDAVLDTTLARGYATEVEELALGRACVAAPIREAGGSIVAGLSISGPLSVIDLGTREETLAGAVIEAADSISVSLGFLAPPGIGTALLDTAASQSAASQSAASQSAASQSAASQSAASQSAASQSAASKIGASQSAAPMAVAEPR